MTQVSPLRQSCTEALALSQQAPRILQNGSQRSAWSHTLSRYLFRDSTELWLNHEKLFLSCLRTGDDKGAFLCLETIIERFGSKHEKVTALRGLYQEAVAEDEAALRKILHEYNTMLVADPTNNLIAKRRIALLRDLNQFTEAIDALVLVLESSPTDVESWQELAELYFSQNLFKQAIFCLEEVVLITPNAWTAHARLGEVLFVEAKNSNDNVESLAESIRRFCRSIELCDHFLRGYYGLKISSDRLLSLLERASGPMVPRHNNLPSINIVKELNEGAAVELARATRRGTKAGYNYAELAAAKAHLQQTDHEQVH